MKDAIRNGNSITTTLLFSFEHGGKCICKTSLKTKSFLAVNDNEGANLFNNTTSFKCLNVYLTTTVLDEGQWKIIARSQQIEFSVEVRWFFLYICQCNISFQYFVWLHMETNGAFQYAFNQLYCIKHVSLCQFFHHLHYSQQNQRVLTKWKYFQFGCSCRAFEKLIMIERLIKIASELLIAGLGLFTISELT